MLLVSALLLALSACQREGDGGQAYLSTDIYIAGERDFVPCIWKNRIPCKLDFPADQLGYALSLFVSGDNVHAAGCVMYPLRSYGAPLYWKDGARVDLPLNPGDMGGVANGIWVAGKDIYVSGFRAVDYYRFSTRLLLAIPCYWKNGVLVSLPVLSDDVGGRAESIFISGDDVYLAGWVVDESGNFHLPCYWKNGQRVGLGMPGTCRSGAAHSLFVMNGDVYVSGTVLSESWVSFPGYWANGTWTELGKIDAGESGWTSGLFVDGRDVHVCGATCNTDNEAVPCIWTNGVRLDLPASPDSRALKVQVFAGDVYVVGNDGSKGPCYWKNNAMVNLVGGGVAEAIMVVNQ